MKPVYIINGFLESGKTTFANETLIERGFTEGEPTLLLVCEEGIEEYDESALCALERGSGAVSCRRTSNPVVRVAVCLRIRDRLVSLQMVLYKGKS